jgi:hypothetical protein
MSTAKTLVLWRDGMRAKLGTSSLAISTCFVSTSS